MYRKLFICLSLIFVTAANNYGQDNAEKIAQNRITALNTLFDSLNSAKAFNGTVLVADSGRVIFEKAYGYADFERKIPMNNQTSFEIASVSKQFTAMAILQLHQAGQLNYSDTVTKYLPDLPYKEVTIGELIHHASGIPDFLGWTKEQMGLHKEVCNNWDVEKALPALAPKTLFEPGTTYSYSNTNYLLLANIVSKITGMPFPQYMQKNVFEKAQMHNTAIPGLDVSHLTTGNHAHNYVWDPLNRKYMPFSLVAPVDYYHYMSGTYGHAGIQATAKDLFNWTQAIRKNTLVPDSIFAAAMRPYLTKNGKDTLGYDNMAYTFGWLLMQKKDRNETFMWHNGGIGGYRSLIVFYPYINRTIVMLQNTDHTANGQAIMPAIVQILGGATTFDWPNIPKIPKAIHLDSAYLHQLVGTYALPKEPTIKMQISTKNGRVYARYMQQISMEIYPSAKDQFFYLDVDAQLIFSQKDGKYYEVTLLQNGHKIPMQRIAQP